MRTDRAGFTLVELMAAMALSGVVLMGSVHLLDAVQDVGRRITDDGITRDAAGASTQLLLALLARAESRPGDIVVFTGTASTLTFRSWCEQPGGWIGRCLVRLGLHGRADTARVVEVAWEGRPAFALGVLGGDAHFAFRETGPHGVAWLNEWGEGIRAPDAVGLISRGDTLLLPVGGGR